MKYFKDTAGGVHGFDEIDPAQVALMNQLTPGWTDITGAWPPAPTLAQAQSAQIASIYSSYQTAIAQNVAYTSKAGVAKTFQADPVSIGNVNDMLSAYGSAQAAPSGFYWVAADNTQVTFTYADLQGLAAAIGAQGWAAFQKLQNYKTQINTATTVAAAQAVVWS